MRDNDYGSDCWTRMISNGFLENTCCSLHLTPAVGFAILHLVYGEEQSYSWMGFTYWTCLTQLVNLGQPTWPTCLLDQRSSDMSHD
jgi:hypothetical protein